MWNAVVGWTVETFNGKEASWIILPAKECTDRMNNCVYIQKRQWQYRRTTMFVLYNECHSYTFKESKQKKCVQWMNEWMVGQMETSSVFANTLTNREQPLLNELIKGTEAKERILQRMNQ